MSKEEAGPCFDTLLMKGIQMPKSTPIFILQHSVNKKSCPTRASNHYYMTVPWLLHLYHFDAVLLN